MNNYDEIEIEIDEETKCLLIENYIRKHFAGASRDLFAEKATDIGVSWDDICKLAGEIVLNQAILDTLKTAVYETTWDTTDE